MCLIDWSNVHCIHSFCENGYGKTVLSSHLVIVIPEADADGTACPGQDSCHGVQIDEHICYFFQGELFIHNGLAT